MIQSYKGDPDLSMPIHMSSISIQYYLIKPARKRHIEMEFMLEIRHHCYKICTYNNGIYILLLVCLT